jgi:hypothetical protein
MVRVFGACSFQFTNSFGFLHIDLCSRCFQSRFQRDKHGHIFYEIHHRLPDSNVRPDMRIPELLQHERLTITIPSTAFIPQSTDKRCSCDSPRPTSPTTSSSFSSVSLFTISENEAFNHQKSRPSSSLLTLSNSSTSKPTQEHAFIASYSSTSSVCSSSTSSSSSQQQQQRIKPNEKVVIRSYVQRDLSSIVAIENEAFGDWAWGRDQLNDAGMIPLPPASLVCGLIFCIVKRQDTWMHVITSESRPCGYVLFSKERIRKCDEFKIHIQSIAVSEKHRGKSYGACVVFVAKMTC